MFWGRDLLVSYCQIQALSVSMRDTLPLWNSLTLVISTHFSWNCSHLRHLYDRGLDIPQQISSMNAIPYALLMDELEKQPKAITVEIERLEESYRSLRTLQIQCKERYVGLEDQIKSAGSNLQLQISGHQTTIAPSQRHPQNVQSMNQLLQVFQRDAHFKAKNWHNAGKWIDFNAASSDLSDVTAKVKALLRKLNAMRETMGLEPEKSAEEREIDELEKKKRFHQNRQLFHTNGSLKVQLLNETELKVEPSAKIQDELDYNCINTGARSRAGISTFLYKTFTFIAWYTSEHLNTEYHN
ncbi:hypothetical protein Ddc_12785 [Ditylenchus destructor]|nr:hypothetical protein Ddc_12785 [Ditylenchus destructor]